jgi:TPP-dependent pyruvate/acetoin dehydrogenase alpha subunit
MMVEVRNESAPQSLVINTYRFGPHSKGDDTRDEDQIRAIRNSRDPIPLLAKSLPYEKIDFINEEVKDEVLKAFQAAVHDPFPEILA